MCVVSMVSDHFNNPFKKYIPPYQQDVWPERGRGYPIDNDEVIKRESKEIKKLIQDFRDAMEAAKKVDQLTNQPDCVDPEKAKLEDRVKKLEDRIKELEERKS